MDKCVGNFVGRKKTRTSVFFSVDVPDVPLSRITSVGIGYLIFGLRQ